MTSPKQTRDDERANRLAGFIQAKLVEMKKEIVEEVTKAVGYPDRVTDRLLIWTAKQKHSYLVWLILGLTHAFVASIWHAVVCR